MKLRLFIGFWSILVAMLIASCSGPEEKKMEFFNKGKALYEKGQYVQARLEFRNSLQIDPNFAEGYHMLGMLEVKERNWKIAYGLLSKAVELDPDISGAQAAIGKILFMAKQTDQAKEKADLVLAKNPDHEDALLLRATCL
ncbi:MAG: tetratricopeptide repeat protein, partial [Desulfobacterales bacterium]|nr:tetratricopeptide repeat protein [Desulfobacterales bacterium]